MRRIYKLASLLFLLLIISCSSSGGTNPPGPVTGNKWTVMVYMDGDNNLSSWANLNLKAMQNVGSTEKVTVIVQLDTYGGTTKRYKVEKGALTLLGDMGELDMADVATLRNFVTFATRTYPADHYALILWDHGQGWKNAVPAGGTKSMFNDYDNGKYVTLLSNYYIADALAEAELETNIKLDILGIDACEMSVIEAAYEFRNAADIFVASQELVSVSGWDYDDLLTRLVNNPGMTPVALSQTMVESFQNYYAHSTDTDQTIAALALSKKYARDGISDIGTLAHTVNDLALRLLARMAAAGTRAATLELLTSSRAAVQEFDLLSPISIDLVDLIRHLEGIDSPVELAFNQLLLAEYHGADRPNAHGLSIVFFNRSNPMDKYIYDATYRNFNPETGAGSRIVFINEFNWDEMLHTYYSLQYPDLPN